MDTPMAAVFRFVITNRLLIAEFSKHESKVQAIKTLSNHFWGDGRERDTRNPFVFFNEEGENNWPLDIMHCRLFVEWAIFYQRELDKEFNREG